MWVEMWAELWVGVLGSIPSNLLKRMAGTTGLEPAASAVTGQRSNQLNYVPTRFARVSGKPLILLSVFAVHRVARSPFPADITEFRADRKWKGSYALRPRASVHAL
jgi:hypothetical protein